MLTSSQRRARAEVTAWARQRIADRATLFLDTETPGLGPDAEIIELAIVDVAGNVLIDTLIAPTRPIPPQATNVHGIVEADVVGAPFWVDVYPFVAEVLRARPVVVYNAAFDRRMVNGCCVAAGFAVEERDWQCAMLQYARFAGERADHHRNKFRFHKLSDALVSFGIPAGSHRALTDAVACRELVRALADPVQDL